jgi:hypothetical protein
MTVLFVQSHSGPVDAEFAQAAESGALRVRREREIEAEDLEAATGLITTIHLDQAGWLDRAAAVRRLLDRGGRWIFNGHILRPFLPGLAVYMPLLRPKRADFALARLAEHPLFAGIDQEKLALNRGVAGFYGRGHNPMPRGGTAINGIGPERLPIDWEWSPPTGGTILVHAGNEFWGCGDDPALKRELAARAVAWAGGRL